MFVSSLICYSWSLTWVLLPEQNPTAIEEKNFILSNSNVNCLVWNTEIWQRHSCKQQVVWDVDYTHEASFSDNKQEFAIQRPAQTIWE